MLHEENELAKIRDQAEELRRDPDLNVAVLGERLQLYREDSTQNNMGRKLQGTLTLVNEQNVLGIEDVNYVEILIPFSKLSTFPGARFSKASESFRAPKSH